MLFHRKTPKPSPLSHPERILIVRFSAIGDIVHSLPLAVALRTRFPRAEIAWLVEEQAAPVLHDHWTLDRMIIVKKNWLSAWTNISLLRKRLRAFAPDVTIDPQGLFKSAFAAWLSGAKTRIGFGGIDARECSGFLNNCRVIPDREHVIDRNMQLLEPFGVAGSSVDFDLAECEIDRCNAQNILNREKLHGNFAILNVGAGWISKLWRENRYAEVAQYLQEQWNLPSLVVWAGEKERVMAENVVHSADGAAFMAPNTTLNELASLSRKATIFVGSDTGPLHIAAAAGTPCVGIFGPVSAKRNGPYGPKNRWVQAKDADKQRDRHDRHNRHLMDSIQAETVCELCDEILAERLSFAENAAKRLKSEDNTSLKWRAA